MKVTTSNPVPDTTMRTGTGKAVLGLSHDFTDTTAQVIMIPIEATLDHDIGIITIITGVTHNAPMPHTGVIAIHLAMTLQRPQHRSSMHRSSSYHSRDRSLLHLQPSYKSSQQDSHRSHLHSSRSQSKPHCKKSTRVKIEDPHPDYYSSDDHSSDSGEDMDHLN